MNIGPWCYKVEDSTDKLIPIDLADNIENIENIAEENTITPEIISYFKVLSAKHQAKISSDSIDNRKLIEQLQRDNQQHPKQLSKFKKIIDSRFDLVDDQMAKNNNIVMDKISDIYPIVDGQIKQVEHQIRSYNLSIVDRVNTLNKSFKESQNLFREELNQMSDKSTLAMNQYRNNLHRTIKAQQKLLLDEIHETTRNITENFDMLSYKNKVNDFTRKLQDNRLINIIGDQRTEFQESHQTMSKKIETVKQDIIIKLEENYHLLDKSILKLDHRIMKLKRIVKKLEKRVTKLEINLRKEIQYRIEAIEGVRQVLISYRARINEIIGSIMNIQLAINAFLGAQGESAVFQKDDIPVSIDIITKENLPNKYINLDDGEEEDYGNILDQSQVIDEASKTSQVKDKGWFEAIIELAKKPLNELQKFFEGKQQLQKQEFTQQLEQQNLQHQQELAQQKQELEQQAQKTLKEGLQNQAEVNQQQNEVLLQQVDQKLSGVTHEKYVMECENQGSGSNWLNCGKTPGPADGVGCIKFTGKGEKCKPCYGHDECNNQDRSAPTPKYAPNPSCQVNGELCPPEADASAASVPLSTPGPDPSSLSEEHQPEAAATAASSPADVAAAAPPAPLPTLDNIVIVGPDRDGTYLMGTLGEPVSDTLTNVYINGNMIKLSHEYIIKYSISLADIRRFLQEGFDIPMGQFPVELIPLLKLFIEKINTIIKKFVEIINSLKNVGQGVTRESIRSIIKGQPIVLKDSYSLKLAQIDPLLDNDTLMDRIILNNKTETQQGGSPERQWATSQASTSRAAGNHEIDDGAWDFSPVESSTGIKVRKADEIFSTNREEIEKIRSIQSKTIQFKSQIENAYDTVIGEARVGLDTYQKKSIDCVNMLPTMLDMSIGNLQSLGNNTISTVKNLSSSTLKTFNQFEATLDQQTSETLSTLKEYGHQQLQHIKTLTEGSIGIINQGNEKIIDQFNKMSSLVSDKANILASENYQQTLSDIRGSISITNTIRDNIEQIRNNTVTLLGQLDNLSSDISKVADSGASKLSSTLSEMTQSLSVFNQELTASHAKSQEILKQPFNIKTPEAILGVKNNFQALPEFQQSVELESELENIHRQINELKEERQLAQQRHTEEMASMDQSAKEALSQAKKITQAQFQSQLDKLNQEKEAIASAKAAALIKLQEEAKKRKEEKDRAFQTRLQAAVKKHSKPDQSVLNVTQISTPGSKHGVFRVEGNLVEGMTTEWKGNDGVSLKAVITAEDVARGYIDLKRIPYPPGYLPRSFGEPYHVIDVLTVKGPRSGGKPGKKIRLQGDTTFQATSV